MFAALTPALPDFTSAHPGIELELITSLGFASLTRREADIAIRQTDSPDEMLVGRKLSLFEQAVYVARVLEARLRAAGHEDPHSWPWIDWDETHRHHSSARWVSENVERDEVTVRCDDSLTMYQLVEAGVGVGFVPTMLAAPDPELVRVEPHEVFPVFQRGIWVLTHEDLRNMGRIRATTQWLAERLRVEGGGVWHGCA